MWGKRDARAVRPPFCKDSKHQYLSKVDLLEEDWLGDAPLVAEGLHKDAPHRDARLTGTMKKNDAPPAAEGLPQDAPHREERLVKALKMRKKNDDAHPAAEGLGSTNAPREGRRLVEAGDVRDDDEHTVAERLCPADAPHRDVATAVGLHSVDAPRTETNDETPGDAQNADAPPWGSRAPPGCPAQGCAAQKELQ